MGLFLILQRELRVLARNPASVHLRFFSILGASAILALLMLFFTIFQRAGLSNAGRTLFGIFIAYCCGLILIGGTFLTVDAMARERREGTLGLLFLTDLRGIEVVLGKWIGSSANAFLILLALAPIAGVCVLFGGVSFVQYWRVQLALFNLLFFTTSLGLCLSCFFQDAVKAGWWAAITLGVLTVILPLVDRGWRGRGFRFVDLDPLAPVYSAGGALSQSYFHPLVGSHLLGWALLILAAWRAQTGWREDVPANSVIGGISRWLKSRVHFERSQVAARKGALQDQHPIGWVVRLSSHDRGMLWTTTVLTAMFSVFLASSPFRMVPFGMLLTSIDTLITFPFLVVVGLKSARFFASARRAGAMELILCTPLSDEEILREHASALRKSVLAPATVIIVAILGSSLMVGWRSGVAGYPPGLLFGLIMYAGYSVLNVLAGLAALIWMGTWLSLRNKRPEWAGGLTVLFILILPFMALCIPSLLIRVVLWAIARGGCVSGIRSLIRGQASAK